MCKIYDRRYNNKFFQYKLLFYRNVIKDLSVSLTVARIPFLSLLQQTMCASSTFGLCLGLPALASILSVSTVDRLAGRLQEGAATLENQAQKN